MAIPTKASMAPWIEIINSEKVEIKIPKLFLPRLINILKDMYLEDTERYLEDTDEIAYDWETSYDVTVVDETIRLFEEALGEDK